MGDVHADSERTLISPATVRDVAVDERRPQAAASVEQAVEVYGRGGAVVVLASDKGYPAGAVVAAAASVTTERVNFMLTHARGVFSVAMHPERLAELGLDDMAARGNIPGARPQFTVSVDLDDVGNTGITAAARAACARGLIDPDLTRNDLRQPGHVFPIRVAELGVLERAGRAEAAVDLAVLAGLPPAAALCTILGPEGEVATRTELMQFADDHGLPLVHALDIRAFRRANESLVRRLVETEIGLLWGPFAAFAYATSFEDMEVVVFVHGDPTSPPDPPVLVHWECTLGDIFASALCGCRAALERGLEAIVDHGSGVVVLLRDVDRRIDFDGEWICGRHVDADAVERQELLADLILDDLDVVAYWRLQP